MSRSKELAFIIPVREDKKHKKGASKMKKSQIKVFEELLNDESFKGKNQLKHLLWLNTSKPKHKIGDCFYVSDPSHRVYGHPVRDFKAKIVGVKAFAFDEDWHYELEMEVECGGKKTISKEYALERDLVKKCKDNRNVLNDPKSKHADSIEVRI